MHILCARARVYYQIFINVNMHCTCNSRKKNISGGPWHMRSRTTAKLKASSFLTARALEYNEFSKLSCFVNKLSSRRRQCISVTSRFFYYSKIFYQRNFLWARAQYVKNLLMSLHATEPLNHIHNVHILVYINHIVIVWLPHMLVPQLCMCMLHNAL